jgi:hypothetical protein
MALKLEDIPPSPHLVPVFKPALAGVDFLNLRQVNFDLMGECIPGTNNATKLVRGYSLITWVYWIYPRILKQLGREEANSEELIHFREKIESLFVWGHKLAGIGGLPGISALVPEAVNGRVDLRFKAWKRSRANTSFEAAVQYGPSLLDLGGLGLLQKLSTGIYAYTKAGAPLGEALDERLRACSAYPFLTDLTLLEGTQEQAEALLPFWRIDEVSPREADTFRSILWDPTVSEERSPRGRRSSMIELIFAVLAAAPEPLGIQEIRMRLALPGLWKSKPLSGGQLKQSRSWLVLQLRQLQRLALESLFSWLERQLKHKGHQQPNALVDAAIHVISEEFGFREGMTVGEVLETAGPPIGDLEIFEEKVAAEPERFSPWSLSRKLREAVVEGSELSLTTGFYSLLLLNQCRTFLAGDDLLARHLERGGASRVSLAHWFRLVDRFRDSPWKVLMDWILKNLIISQHLAVGTQRFDGEKIRLRMILEEDGLESLVQHPWQPGVTPDRLSALLSLLVGSGVVTQPDQERYTLL